MQCLLSLMPRNKKFESFEEIIAEISPSDLQQLESMCEEGINGNNQTFNISLSIDPLRLGRHNYDLVIQILINGLAVEYAVENTMTQEKSASIVEFIVVHSVTKRELND